ncbi:MAG: hypothetical protein CL693_16430, partial [Cellvibrionaceae bacterium]|nr:hypothetical protein [Cellvibrionaceae bacterium]
SKLCFDNVENHPLLGTIQKNQLIEPVFLCLIISRGSRPADKTLASASTRSFASITLRTTLSWAPYEKACEILFYVNDHSGFAETQQKLIVGTA